MSSAEVLLWCLLVIVILAFAINMFKKSDSLITCSSPNLFKYKYEKGEISKEELEQMLKLR